MVCGLCHREPDDHAESSSGPTRCQYKTHREDCPGGFKTNCNQGIKETEETETKTDVKVDENIMEKLTESLKSLDLSSPSDSQGLVLKLQQIFSQSNIGQSSFPQEGSPAQETDSPAEILTAISHLLKTPTPVTDPHQPHSSPSSAGLEQLASQHVANNQPFLEKTQYEASYKGPNINEVRKDRATQDKVSQVIEALKHISPVFGQANSQAAQSLPGISPLDQLKQQLCASALPPKPQPHYDPLQQLNQLLGQGQHSVQPVLGYYPPHHQQQQGLFAQQPPLHQPLLASHISPPQQPSLHSQLSQLLTGHQGFPTLGNQAPQAPVRGVHQHAHRPPVPQLQHMSVPQLLQHPDLLQQLAATMGQQAAQPQHGLLEFPNLKSKQQPLQPAQPLSQLQGQSRAVHVRPTDYSRYCQVEYSEKVKADNANLVMFCYGYIAQILASRQGHIAQMTDAEVNGRLQHLLHLLELTAMFSSNTEYSSYAWHRARNYNSRIFSDLDHGSTTWSGISSKMNPTNLMQAIEAVPKEFKKKEDDKKKKAEEGPPCPKWNTCDVQGKCSYEADNPGRTCNRPHICSYCYNKFGYTRTNHKESACKKKEEADSSPSSGAGSGSGSQPTR